jgi:excinuclease UvrABC nuclease subunit
VSWSLFHDYNASNVKAYAPTSGGVYEIYAKLKNGGRTLIYVGQASNLEERLLQHLQDSEPNDCLRNNVSKFACEFRYLRVSSAAERDSLETKLIQTGNPDCNVQKK